jgi:hypothetical protein
MRTPDILDQASESEALHLAQALLLRKAAPSACGACHNCAEPLEPGLQFCDRTCRDDYDHRARLRAQSGAHA